MPVIGDDEEVINLNSSNYGYSATKLTKLGATEYTIVGIGVDCSGSTCDFTAEMEAALKEIISSCASSPRSDNLLVRTVLFDHNMVELHGFKELSTLNPGDYTGKVFSGGMTALYDTTLNLVESIRDYGERLYDDADMSCNGILFIITDGSDNASKYGTHSIKSAIENTIKNEKLESFVPILVSVNSGSARLKIELNKFETEAGFSQHIELEHTNKSSLAKLAQFISKSISAQSNVLGTGGPSQALTF